MCKERGTFQGGSDGLGKALALHLSKDHNVHVLARSADKLQSLTDECNCRTYVCDVTDQNALEEVLTAIATETVTIDVLINNAGLWIQGPLEENDPIKLKQVIDVNVTGLIQAIRTVIPYMKQQKKGTIIQINSQAGFYSKVDRSVYVASKWAVTGFTKAIQKELEPHGISVVGLYPGALEVSMAKGDGKHNRPGGINLTSIAKTVEFALSFDDGTSFPEIGITNIGEHWGN